MAFRHYGTPGPKVGAPLLAHPPAKIRYPIALIFGSVVLAFMGAAILFTATSSSRDMLSSTVASLSGSVKKDVTTKNINFTFKRRGYDVVPYFDSNYDSFLNYAFLKKYVAIIEPYLNMEVHLYDGATSGNYKVEVCSVKGGDCQTGFSYTNGKDTVMKSIRFQCSPYDEFDITAYELNENKEIVAQKSGKGVCLYVRRELRSLSDEDRNAFLDASYKLTEVSDEEGAKLYGPDFHSSTYIVRFHHFNAAQQDQDHIHEGNGFLTQHLKMTNMFDAAVRSVDPSQSLPYWDYTKDNKEGKMSWDATISDSKMYGNVQVPGNVNVGYTYSTDKIIDGRIRDGRWKDLKAEKNTFYPDLDYGFGYMRAPWNMNPSPYVSRFPFDFGGSVTLPSCSSFYSILQYTDMMDFFYRSAFGPHATAHTVMAGFFGCDKFLQLSEAGYIKSDLDAYAVCSSWSFFIKECWRNDYVRARKGCTVTDDINESKCGFDCNPDTTSDLTAFLFPQMRLWVDSTKEGAEDAWLNFICGGDAGLVFTGDHLESASPADPSFWVIHPTIERVLHAKFMSGGFETETWATDATNDYVCNRPRCFNSTTGTKDYYSDCCYGHYENDRLMDAISGNRFEGVGPTNAEMVAAMDPRGDTYSMPYVYDKFTWDHCEEDILGLLSELRTDMLNGKSRDKHPDQHKDQESKKNHLTMSKTF